MSLVGPLQMLPSGCIEACQCIGTIYQAVTTCVTSDPLDKLILMDPQQKKQLSYKKDRRNTYGENSKSSRKNIPLSKALGLRAERRAQESALAKATAEKDGDRLDAIENVVRSTKPRVWRKQPDDPLGKVLTFKSQRAMKPY